MKRIILILVLPLVIGNLFAQTADENGQSRLFQKLVLDIGATPLSTSLGDNPQLTSYNFSLGYQIIKRLDVRLNMDIQNIVEETNEVGSDLNYYERLVGISIGIGCIILKGNENSFLKNTSFGLVGKAGAGIEPELREQESLFVDLSARAYLGKSPYIALGINHHNTDLFAGSDFTSLYLAFGIDF